MKDFLITSDGKKLKNNRQTKHYAKKLKEAEQHLSRKQKGSDGFEKKDSKLPRFTRKLQTVGLIFYIRSAINW